MADALVVYYSRTGHTQSVAQQLAATLGADLEEIMEPGSRAGVVGYARSAFDSIARRFTRLQPPRHDPANYRHVFVGGPVWNASVSAPVRTYLMENRNRLPDVAFFATFGGAGARRAFRKMEHILGHAPVSKVAIREKDLGKDAANHKIQDLAAVASTRAQNQRKRARRAKALAGTVREKVVKTAASKLA